MSRTAVSDLTLAAYVGEEVTVRYDPRDLAEIRVFHEGGFLCRAVSAKLAASTISRVDLQTARNQRRRELRTELTSRRSWVDALRHPVIQRVASDAVTPTPGRPPMATEEPEATTKLKLYRNN